MPAYETFTTLLACAVGLPVIDIELRSINKIHYTITERYDRFPGDDGEILRAHQEDFCQALGYGHEKKYQEDGGPSFAQCFGMLRDVSSDPATDLPHLLRWQIFNVLAGNSDGHAKNLSLLHTPDGEVRLAPFYDLVCTRAIDRIDHHLGIVRWKGKKSRRYSQATLGRYGQAMRHPIEIPALILLTSLPPSCLRISAPTRALFEEQFGEYRALQRIEQVIKKQCGRTRRN